MKTFKTLNEEIKALTAAKNLVHKIPHAKKVISAVNAGAEKVSKGMRKVKIGKSKNPFKKGSSGAEKHFNNLSKVHKASAVGWSSPWGPAVGAGVTAVTGNVGAGVAALGTKDALGGVFSAGHLHLSGKTKKAATYLGQRKNRMGNRE